MLAENKSVEEVRWDREKLTNINKTKGIWNFVMALNTTRSNKPEKVPQNKPVYLFP